MKNKKRLIPIVATAMLSMALPVFAANITTETSQNVTVTHTVGESYTVSIPADFSFEANDTNYIATKTVNATGVLIEAGNTLNVKMSSENYTAEKGYTLQDSSKESKIVYTIQNGEQAFENGENILSVEAGTESASTELKFSTTSEEISKATKSGDHTDKLTFTVSVD